MIVSNDPDAQRANLTGLRERKEVQIYSDVSSDKQLTERSRTLNNYLQSSVKQIKEENNEMEIHFQESVKGDENVVESKIQPI